jgi:hypothetical protein
MNPQLPNDESCTPMMFEKNNRISLTHTIVFLIQKKTKEIYKPKIWIKIKRRKQIIVKYKKNTPDYRNFLSQYELKSPVTIYYSYKYVQLIKIVITLKFENRHFRFHWLWLQQIHQHFQRLVDLKRNRWGVSMNVPEGNIYRIY